MASNTAFITIASVLATLDIQHVVALWETTDDEEEDRV